jgi:hypothetical protein
MSRIFLCGMTQNQVDNIRALTDPIYQEVDGLCFVDHESTDGTRELLEERKGAGKIISRPFRMNHDFSLNHILLDGGFKEGDLLLFRDSMERFNPEFAKNIRKTFDSFIMAGFKTFYNYGKPFAVVYHDGLYINGAVHWGIENTQPKAIDLRDYHNEDNHEWTWRLKDGEEGGRPADNKIDHEARYYFVYGRSNHLLLGRENDLDSYRYLEMIRLHTREYARQKGFERTLDGLKEFMKWGMDIGEREEQEVEQFKIWVNSCSILKNFYRKHILAHKWEDIKETENSWVLK